MEDFANYKVADFKRELKSRGLNSSGTKNELQTRLLAAIATEKSVSGEDSAIMDDSLIDEDSMLEDEEDESGSEVESSNEEDSPVNLSSPVKTPEKKDPGTNLSPVATKIASPMVQPLATEKAQNGDQSGIPLKKKKITINRLPVQTPLPPATTEATPPAAVATVPAPDPLKNAEKLAEAKVVKLSVAAAAAERIKSRQEKFGAVTNVTNSSIVASAPVGEKLKKRGDRFGSSSSTGSGGGIAKVVPTAEDEAKLAKRKERFGLLVADDKSPEVVAAKEKRSARFGGGAAAVTTPEIEERKIKRAARFATAT